jgi:hypothetical protein
VVYAREVKGTALTFQVSGLLWNRSLIMRDVESKSLWSHILGRCMQGAHAGATLKMLPSTMTTWADWKATYPGTTVLNMSRVVKGFTRRFYKRPEGFVFGVVVQGQAKAYGLERLMKRPVIQDKIQGVPLVIVYDAASTRAAVFRRKVNGEVLSFKPRPVQNRLIDKETGTQWNPATGEAVEGPRKGSRMTPLVGILSFRFAWKLFHPETEWWGGVPHRRR